MKADHRPLCRWVSAVLFLTAGAVSIGAEDNIQRTSHLIDDIIWIPQTWNNCGPATLAMGLDHWGVTVSQQDIADIIRPNPNDGHVSVEQIRMAAASLGLESRYIPSGDLELIRSFVQEGFPVMMPTWHIDSDSSQMGHYRLVHGFDDETGRFNIRDSLEPVGYSMTYETFDLLWRVFNRRMLIVYPANRATDLEGITRDLDSDILILESSLDRASGETEPPASLPAGMSAANYRAYADYNRAMALTELGRYTEAAAMVRSAFEHGLPWRMLWYQPEVLEAMFMVGEYEWIISRAGAALGPYPYLEELWYWVGRSEKELGRADEADQAFRRALEIRPGWDLAIREIDDSE